MNDEKLRELFATCGEIVSAKVMVDHDGNSLGFGFVRFVTREGANNAILQMPRMQIANKTLLCKRANSTTFAIPSTNLYIKPLPSEWTEKNLVNLFASFGTILKAKVLKDKDTGKSKQIGFVLYETQENATKAMENMNASKPSPYSPCLIVKYAETDHQRVTRQAHRRYEHPPAPVAPSLPVAPSVPSTPAPPAPYSSFIPPASSYPCPMYWFPSDAVMVYAPPPAYYYPLPYYYPRMPHR